MSPSEFRRQNNKIYIPDSETSLFFNPNNASNTIFNNALDFEKKLKMDVEEPETFQNQKLLMLEKLENIAKKPVNQHFKKLLAGL